MIESKVPFVDDYLATYHVQSQHSIEIRASTSEIYEATRSLDLSSSRMVRTLFRLRGLPTSALTIDGLASNRFLPLLEQPPNGFVLGIVGQFWSPSGRLVAFDPSEFRDLQTPHYAKAIWSFDVTQTSPSTAQLRTVTRVVCPDQQTRRRFRLYWTFVGPFSGMIRREVLSMVKKRCEQSRDSMQGRRP